MSLSIVDAVRRPEHTGENRCRPCTALNLALVGAAAVALRGYVVPHTPAFAPRVAAALPVSFGHEIPEAESIPVSASADTGPPAASDDLSDAGAADAEAAGRRVVDALFAAGALRESGNGQLRLDDGVREARAAEMARLRDADDETLAAAVADAAPYPAVARVEHGGVTVEATEAAEAEAAETNAAERTAWLTRALAVADAASVRALRDAGVAPETAARAAVPLRTLLERCPLCGGRVVETTYAQCCGGSGSIYETPEMPVLACDDCGEVVHRLDE